MRDLAQALWSLYPGSKWTMNGDDYSNLNWSSDNVIDKPSKEELEAEADRIHHEYLNKQYQRDRAKEYPRLEDQLDALFHAGVFPPEMAAQIQAVKDKYPKGS